MQLKQIVKELKKTKYRPTMTTLSSRDQACIHPDLQYLKRHQYIPLCK